jgi:hypothetical protein
MKTQIINGRVEVINETRDESIETLNYFFDKLGLEPLKERDLRDWGIVGGETNSQLSEWANDYASEIHTDKCAGKNAWRYNQ